MIRHKSRGLVYYTLSALERKGVAHAVVTRLGGGSQSPFSGLNVGHALGDDPQIVQANHHLIFDHWGLQPQEVVTARQVHGHGVAVVGSGDGGRIISATDSLVTADPGVVLLLRFADCVPVFLYDPHHHALALGHAGWRGIVVGLAQSMVHTMSAELHSDPPEIIAALGPAVGPCCYNVGEEVIAGIESRVPHWERAVERRNGAFYLDMWQALQLQLAESGVTTVETGNICTADNTQEFFSHRREKGRTGRFASLAWLTE